MLIWHKLLWVCLGGMCGAASRFLVSEGMKVWVGTRFPWGTFTVNMLGSLCMGFVFALGHRQLVTDQRISLFLAVGFLGSFTTFSSFALDNVHLIQAHTHPKWLLNIGIQNALGLALVWCGMWLASLIPTP